MNEPKRISTNIYKVSRHEPWTLKDVIVNFSGKSYEEVVKEQREKRKEK